MQPAAAATAAPTATADPIESLDALDCLVPLPRPLRVGAATVTHRGYVITRVRTESGLEGVGFAFARGLPVAAIVNDSFAPVARGLDATLPEAVRARLAAAYWPYADGTLFGVAVSAVDLALWDLQGKRLGVPVADLLGRRAHAVPFVGVASYASGDAESLGSLEAELGRFADLGCRSVKLVVGALSPERDAERVALARRLVGDDGLVVVDAFRSFAGVDEGLRRLRPLAEHRIGYVEDPFAESLLPLVADLRARSGLSIALGENVSGHRAHRLLVESGCVDVVRCDVSVVGGVREFLAVAALASSRGLTVSTHTHPEIHVHVAAAIPNLYPGGVEYMEPDAGLDAFHVLQASGLELRDGAVAVPQRPGLGLDLDWDAVARYAR
jgi:D-arabinonate dehydratase